MVNDPHAAASELRDQIQRLDPQAAGELTRRLDRSIRPQVISDLLYQRKVADDLCPLVGDRRLITAKGLSAIEDVLRQRFDAEARGDR